MAMDIMGMILGAYLVDIRAVSSYLFHDIFELYFYISVLTLYFYNVLPVSMMNFPLWLFGNNVTYLFCGYDL